MTPYQNEQDIFNGKFKLITEDNEFRMSHWVKGFGIFDNSSNDWLLELNRSLHLEKFEESETAIVIYFKVYPNGATEYKIEINPFNKTFTYKNQTLSLKDFDKLWKTIGWREH